MLDRLSGLLEQIGRPRIGVVGDVMLDTYVWGSVSRISPEGPIPVLKVARREHRPGGAGSVSAMLAALRAEAITVGVVGADGAALTLRQQMEKAGMGVHRLVDSTSRPTTTKTRYLGYVQSAGRALQQLVRVDEEDTTPLSPEEQEAVERNALECLAEAEALVLQDMGKGFFNDSMLRELIQQAREAGKPVIVDPERTDSYGRYAGATAVLPNRHEAEKATGLTLRREPDYRAAAEKLLSELSLQSVVIKLDRDGLYYATAAGRRQHVTTHAREVADVTGAGDMVTAVFSLALAEGLECRSAAALANFAAGLEVAERGVTPIARRTLLNHLQAATDPISLKIVDRSEVAELASEFHRQGRRVAFTNGCFDLLHIGHVQLLRYASEQGDVLLVGVNSDASARKLKGPGRPINSEQVRSRIIASLADVDYVVLFEEQSVLPLIREVRPDVLVKGGDYTREEVVGHEFVESSGGEVKLAPLAKGFSTTELIEKIAQNHDRQD